MFGKTPSFKLQSTMNPTRRKSFSPTIWWIALTRVSTATPFLEIFRQIPLELTSVLSTNADETDIVYLLGSYIDLKCLALSLCFIQCASAHTAGPVYGFVSLWCVGLISFFVWRPNSLWKTRLRRSIPNSIYFLHNSTRSVQKAPKIEPTRAKMEPKGPNLAQNGAERGPENIEKWMPEKSSARGRLP